MAEKKGRRLTQILERSRLREKAFATPSVPTVRTRRRTIQARSDPTKVEKIKFPEFLGTSEHKRERVIMSEKTIMNKEKTKTRRSEDIDRGEVMMQGFYMETPTTRLVRPDPEVFLSTGILMKKSSVKSSSGYETDEKTFAPETPCKRVGLMANSMFGMGTGTPPIFSMSRYENEAKEKQSPLQLGKHKDSGGIGDEEVYSSKRRYLSPVELYCDSSGTFEIGSKREERLRQLVDGQSTDKRHRLDDDHHKSDSYEGPGNIEHEQTRQRSVSCAVSEFGTTCSTVTLQPSVQPSDQPLLLDMLISASNDSTEMMVCDNASRAMDDPLLPPLGKLEMSSPMIVPEERPQMPQIIGGYATNYPHFLTAEYFQAAQQAGGTSAYFGPPIEDHSPVDENGFLDYYRYQFDELSTLGKGHSSHVYMVRCLEDGKTYALKRSIRPFQGRKDRVRKLTEVSAMWLLDSHPNLVRLVNSWEQFGLLYILSDLCDQGDLQSLLNSFNLPVPEPFVWKLLSAVSSGLAHIHSHDFVHLDLKPANICFADNYATIKIADFGLASPISSLPSPSSSSPSPDHEGDRVYLAPEVLHHGLCGKPADIFSLGLIVLEMCANVVLPHNGEEYSQLRSNNLSSAQLDLVSISDELRSLISQMLDSDPSKRPTAQHIASLPLCSTYSQIPFNLH